MDITATDVRIFWGMPSSGKHVRVIYTPLIPHFYIAKLGFAGVYLFSTCHLSLTVKQGSKCPSLPGFTHGFYPGKPGLGFKPYFEKVGT